MAEVDNDKMWVTVITPESMAREIVEAIEYSVNNPEGYALIRHVSIEEVEKMYPRGVDG